MQFKDIIGQKDIIKRLIQTVKGGRISHAQLFLGPEGSGKLPLAIAYAQYINCHDKKEDDSCGVCSSCIKFQKLVHPDLHFVYPVSTTKEVTKNPVSVMFLPKWRELLARTQAYFNLNDWYEEIEIEKKQSLISALECNEIIKTLSYTTYEAEYKIMIIWMAEKLHHAAAPKILKILEEPPDKTLFFLITENHDQIIPTIISRTQLVKVPRINDHELSQYLHEKYQVPAQDIKKCISVSSGNFIEARNWFGRNEDEQFYFQQFIVWMRACYKIDFARITPFIEEIASLGRERQKSFFLHALSIIRDCLLCHFTENAKAKFDGEELQFVTNFSKFVHVGNSQQIINELNKAYYHIERNANPTILLFDLSLTIYKLMHVPDPLKN